MDMAEDVLELTGEHGRMVEDEVELEIEPEVAQGFQIARRRIQLVEPVVDHREAAIEVGVEDAGEQVHRAEGALHHRV